MTAKNPQKNTKQTWIITKKKLQNVHTVSLQQDSILERQTRHHRSMTVILISRIAHISELFRDIMTKDMHSQNRRIPDGTNKEVVVRAIEDEDGRAMESAPHPKQMVYVDFGEEIKDGYLLRRQEVVEEEN